MSKKIITIITCSALMILALVLVCGGQRHVGYAGILTMLAGVAIIIGLLYFYNRKYK